MVLHVPELHVLAVRPPGLAWLKSGIATALKPPHEAGGRGGESTARWRWCGFYFFSVSARRDGA
ncbi:hypothetical protein EGT26_16650 [Escherichia coli]|nr:hypothetical protein [Escherichia coli]EEW7565453.1 hypothetical protein [Escherichia coli]EEW8233092.1 hypothetical protein [Escherichia coli]EGD5183790.1 hypothetical protein [Escherichia coli]EGD7258252.1 hypothetical protein [Escherichia coli]